MQGNAVTELILSRNCEAWASDRIPSWKGMLLRLSSLSTRIVLFWTSYIYIRKFPSKLQGQNPLPTFMEIYAICITFKVQVGHWLPLLSFKWSCIVQTRAVLFELNLFAMAFPACDTDAATQIMTEQTALDSDSRDSGFEIITGLDSPPHVFGKTRALDKDNPCNSQAASSSLSSQKHSTPDTVAPVIATNKRPAQSMSLEISDPTYPLKFRGFMHMRCSLLSKCSCDALDSVIIGPTALCICCQGQHCSQPTPISVTLEQTRISLDLMNSGKHSEPNPWYFWDHVIPVVQVTFFYNYS